MASNRSLVYRSRVRAWLAGGLYLLARALTPGRPPAGVGKTRVLVFHHIDGAAAFGKILRALARRYRLLSFEEYCAGRKDPARLNIIIAFDDGYRSWFTNARPVLARYGVRPLLAVNSDFAGLEPTAARAYCAERIGTWPEESVSWEQLRTLAAEGAEICGHALRHANLARLGPEEALEAIGQDRRDLAEKLGAAPRAFAYPSGLYTPETAQAAQRAGYLYAFTSDSGFLEDSEGPFLLKRTNVGLRPPFIVEAFAEGWGDRISAVMRFLRGRERR